MEHDPNATDDGVLDAQNNQMDPEDKPISVLDRRQQLLESIAGTVNSQREEEMKAAGQEVPEAFQEGAAEKTEEKTSQEETPKAESTPEKVKLVVDGQEREVPLSEVLDAGKRTLQKETAADRRLEEATRLLKEAQAAREAPPAKGEQDKSKPDAEKATKVAGLTQAIRYGSDDEASKAALELLELGSKGPNMDEAMSVMESRLNAKSSAEKLFNQFSTDYPQIVGNPRLLNLAGQIVNESVQGGTGNFTDYATYQKAAAEVIELLGQKAEKKPVEDLSDKEKRKKEASDHGVKPAEGRSPAGEQPETERSPSDIVMEMKKNRGQLI